HPRMVSRLAVFSLILLIVESAPAQSAPSPANFRTDAFHEGGNEYEVWSGYSPNSLQWIGKTEGRRLFMAGFGWRRVIIATNSVAWKFTVDAVPIALVSQPTITGNQAVLTGAFPNLVFAGCMGPSVTFETVNATNSPST